MEIIYFDHLDFIWPLNFDIWHFIWMVSL
jgi:hypothetical protein